MSGNVSTLTSRFQVPAQISILENSNSISCRFWTRPRADGTYKTCEALRMRYDGKRH